MLNFLPDDLRPGLDPSKVHNITTIEAYFKGTQNKIVIGYAGNNEWIRLAHVVPYGVYQVYMVNTGFQAVHNELPNVHDCMGGAVDFLTWFNNSPPDIKRKVQVFAIFSHSVSTDN